MRRSPTSEHSLVRRIEIDLADLDLERFCIQLCCVNALLAGRASAERTVVRLSSLRSAPKQPY